MYVCVRYRQQVHTHTPVEVVAVTQDESLIGITLSVGKSDSGVTHVRLFLSIHKKYRTLSQPHEIRYG